MAFQLRIATVDDVSAIRMLIAASVRELQVEYTAVEREAALATVFTMDSTLIADGTYFVAYAEDGRLAGCGGWSKRRTLYGGDNQVETIEPELLDPATEAAKIRAIFVHPDFARQGLGSSILETSEAAAAGAGFRRYEMGSTLTGEPLYELRGYHRIARIEVPVGVGQTIDVIRMRKDVQVG